MEYFNLDKNYTYNEDSANELFSELVDFQQKLEKRVNLTNPTAEEKFDNLMNPYKKKAEEYDCYNSDLTLFDNQKSRYAYICNSLYNFPKTDVFGRPKEFYFDEQFEKYASMLGTKRSITKKEVITPYFTPTAPENISKELSKLYFLSNFGWNDKNPLIKAIKIIPSITGIQPLQDNNHKLSHALLQYYLGNAGLPAIERNSHLKEHYEAYLECEREAIEKKDIIPLIDYYYYNIRERQELIAKEFNIPEQEIFGKSICIEDVKL